MKHKILILCGLVMLAAPALALEVVVPSVEAPSIADALALPDISLVEIMPGLYYEHDLEIPGGVTVRGLEFDADQVIIDAEGQGRVFLTNGDEPAYLLFVTLRNGRAYGDDPRGGGVLSSGVGIGINSVKIHDCEAVAGGGVAAIGATFFSLLSVEISDCHALVAGGAVFTQNTSHAASGHRGLTLARNSAGQSGGAVYAVGAGDGVGLKESTLVANQAPLGSAVVVWNGDGATASMEKTLIALNQVGAPVFSDRTACYDILCTDIALNAGGDWTGVIAGQQYQPGNLSEDPQFCDPGSGVWSVAEGSPCVTAACGDIGAWGVGCETVGNEPDDDETPAVLAAFAAHPNPFNPETEIVFSMVAPGRVSLSVYDLSGRRVRTLVDEARSAGNHHVTWRGQDDSGRSVSSGVYLAVIRQGDRREALRLALVK